MKILKEIKKLGYKIVYVPHSIIKEHIACYNVEYKGKIIAPAVAEILRIPFNEIWISQKFKKQEDEILFHELNEIKYRWEGCSQKEAHRKAKMEKTIQ